MENLELTARYVLDENWELDRPIGGESGALSVEDDLLQTIRSVRIEVAPQGQTRIVSKTPKSQCLLSELGMNIVVPRGSINELRFKATLLADGEIGTDLLVLDGFPKGQVSEHSLIDGKITLGLSKLFQFIPVVGPVVGGTLGELLKIDLNPWQFQIGHIRNVQVDFSGSQTFEPEWYYRQPGLSDDLHVTLTIQKPSHVKTVEAQVEAAWSYDPGFLRPLKVSSDAKKVSIFPV